MFCRLVLCSPHKLPGGPGSPGVLVVKKRLVHNAVPTTPGGGTVFYVTADHHRYIENLEEREEGGTPNILGAIRAGLVFHLKESVGPRHIRSREDAMMARALGAWSSTPNLHLLGPSDGVPRVPVVPL